MVGAARVARLAGIENALAFDMGGTSTDVCAIVGGEAPRSHERLVGGLPIRLPTLDVHTVGAGGGSLVWRDAGGALRVGPQSAGADPGPACYGRGGERRDRDRRESAARPPARRLAGGLELDREAAARALARRLEPAAVVEVVDAEMLAALRVVSVERGLDPRDFALVAFGGAGALHACALAEELEIDTVLVPAAAGVLSALGLALSDERRDEVRSLVVPLAEAGELPDDGEADLRYARPVVRADGAARRRPGRALPSRARGAVRLRRPDEAARARRGADRPRAPRPAARRRRHGPRSSPGQACVELEGSTCWIPDGWAGEMARRHARR